MRGELEHEDDFFSFEDHVAGISASLGTIFCGWVRKKDEREEKKRRKKRKVATTDVL